MTAQRYADALGDPKWCILMEETCFLFFCDLFCYVTISLLCHDFFLKCRYFVPNFILICHKNRMICQNKKFLICHSHNLKKLSRRKCHKLKCRNCIDVYVENLLFKGKKKDCMTAAWTNKETLFATIVGIWLDWNKLRSIPNKTHATYDKSVIVGT